MQLSWISKIFPKIPFWKNFISKFLSFFISLKIYIIAIATYLLWVDKISDVVWSTVVVSIALGRVLIQGIMAHQRKDSPIQTSLYDSPQPLPPLKNDGIILD